MVSSDQNNRVRVVGEEAESPQFIQEIYILKLEICSPLNQKSLESVHETLKYTLAASCPENLYATQKSSLNADDKMS